MAAFVLVVGCVGLSCDDNSTCVSSVDLTCAPLYEPEFEQVFTRTLKPGCAVAGNCHSGPNAKAGIRMDEIEETYRLLIDDGLVVPNDASCSLLVARLEGSGPVMPPGQALSEAERCAIEQWVANGALR